MVTQYESMEELIADLKAQGAPYEHYTSYNAGLDVFDEWINGFNFAVKTLPNIPELVRWVKTA